MLYGQVPHFKFNRGKFIKEVNKELEEAFTETSRQALFEANKRITIDTGQARGTLTKWAQDVGVNVDYSGRKRSLVNKNSTTGAAVAFYESRKANLSFTFKFMPNLKYWSNDEYWWPKFRAVNPPWKSLESAAKVFKDKFFKRYDWPKLFDSVRVTRA